MELSLGELSLGVFTFVFLSRVLLCIWIYVWIYALFQYLMDISLFYVWYVSCFEVGMNLCV